MSAAPTASTARNAQVIIAVILAGAALRWLADIITPLLLAIFLPVASVLSGTAVLASGAAGLADAHAGSVAAASLCAQGGITVDTALAAIAAALGSNLLVKAALAFTAGGRRFGLGFAAGMAAPAAVFAAALIAVVAFG
jgi:uncharacterized membrane protein (DUF4010 family)